jgi:hypothetical protein
LSLVVKKRIPYRPTLPDSTEIMSLILQKHLNENCSGTVQNNHYTYWIPQSIYNDLPIKRWKYNRPPDKERVAEIHDFMNESKRMDGMLYVACVNKELVCYESNHRREALVGIEGMNPILVDILWDATDESVKAEFLRLNKAVSVPELYVSEEASVDPKELIKMRDTFCETYKSHKSTSNHPNAPNFNSDMVMNEFLRIIQERKLSPSEFWTRLMRLNTIMSTRDRKKLTPKIIEKCERSGLWLFAWSRVLNAKDF